MQSYEILTCLPLLILQMKIALYILLAKLSKSRLYKARFQPLNSFVKLVSKLSLFLLTSTFKRFISSISVEDLN